MTEVFISHTEQDADVALAIALELESAGYRTWSYEQHQVVGVHYMEQMCKAIDGCAAFLLVISPSALKSRNINIEVMRAHQSGRRLIPILYGLTQEQFQHHEPKWGGALGGTISFPLKGPHDAPAIAHIRESLKTQRVSQSEPDQTRVLAIRELIRSSRWPQGRIRLSRRLAVILTVVGALAVVGTLLAPIPWSSLWRSGARRQTLARGSGTGIVVGDSDGSPAEVTEPIVVGVMDFTTTGVDDRHDWMRQSTRNSFNTILRKVRGLGVVAEEMIDFLRRKRGLEEIEAAEQLKIRKLIRCRLLRAAATLTLEVRVIDMQTNLLDDSFVLSRSEDKIVDLQNGAVLRIVQALHIQLSPDEQRTLFAERTDDTADSLRLLSDTLGDFSGAAPEPVTLRRTRGWVPAAYALEGESTLSPDQEAIAALLDRYSKAIQAADIEQLKGALVNMNDKQRDTHEKYFASVEGLQVHITDVNVMVEGDEAVATFTRQDSFTEKKTGRPRSLEVRLTSLLKKEGGAWKIASFAK